MAETTWKPHNEHGKLDTEDREGLPDSAYAFPKQRKEPMTDASHVRNALARFDQVKGVSDTDRDQAWANLQKAAKHYGVEIEEKSWHDLGKKPHTKNPSHCVEILAAGWLEKRGFEKKHGRRAECDDTEDNEINSVSSECDDRLLSWRVRLGRHVFHNPNHEYDREGDCWHDGQRRDDRRAQRSSRRWRPWRQSWRRASLAGGARVRALSYNLAHNGAEALLG